MNGCESTNATSYGQYAFPASVRLLRNKSFIDLLASNLKERINENSQPELYRQLFNVFRRAGELELAKKVLAEWIEEFPEQDSCYLKNLFFNQVVKESPYGVDELQPAPFYTCSDFLTPNEYDYYWAKAMGNQQSFLELGVSNSSGVNTLDRNVRQTEQLILSQNEKQLMKDKIATLVPELLERFKIPIRPLKKIEVKLTTHLNDGFFKIHHDAYEIVEGSSRFISWVCHLHKVPKQFSGGDLVLFDSDMTEQDRKFSNIDYTRYIVKSNEIVFFPSSFYHGVTPVELVPNLFKNSRFALTGHIRLVEH